VSKTKHTQAVQPARHHTNALGQLLKLIPRSLIHHASKETGDEAKARTFSPIAHLGAMLCAQLARALSLNDVCGRLRLKARAIAAFGLTPPSRNNLSNANQGRDAKCAGPVFWRTLVRAACATFVVRAGTLKCSSSK